MRSHSTAAASSGSDRVSRSSSARMVRSLLTIPATAYAGPALGGGPAPAASMKVCLASRKISGDLTTGALIGAFIGSVSARADRVSANADAETLSITRLEGSRWRGGRLWNCRSAKSERYSCAQLDWNDWFRTGHPGRKSRRRQPFLTRPVRRGHATLMREGCTNSDLGLTCPGGQHESDRACA